MILRILWPAKPPPPPKPKLSIELDFDEVAEFREWFRNGHMVNSVPNSVREFERKIRESLSDMEGGA